LHRGTLVPILAGIFAILVAAPVLASSAGDAGAAGTSPGTSTGTSGVRGQEWWLAELGAQQAWRTSKGAGITVAVLSTGVAAAQPDLAGDVITGPDYTGSGRYAGGPYWGAVGTAVASIIAGHGHGAGDKSGIIGIAPQAKILSVRVTLEYNDPLNAISAITQRLPGAIAEGILYAVNRGAKVIDLPLDPGTFGLAGDGAAAGGSPAERSAVRYALDKGVVLVAPAGDNGSTPGQTSYPAAYPGVVAVGATGRDGQLAWFSDKDSSVSLTAPGMDLMAATMLPSPRYGYGPGYAQISTTSAASAMVAGVAALVVSRYPQLTVSQVVRALRSSPVGGPVGGTLVNADRALSVAAKLSPRQRVVQSRAPTTTPVKPHRAVHTTAPAAAPKASQRATAGMLAGAVLRDAVLAVCALVLLVVVVLLTTRVLIRARRARTQADIAGVGSATRVAAGSRVAAGIDTAVGAGIGAGAAGAAGGRQPGRGLHEQRRGHDVFDPSPGAPTTTPMTGASLAGGALAGIPLTVEVSHSPAASQRQLIMPIPRSTRSRPADPGTSPPWAPAAEPVGLDTPVPVMPSGWFPGEPEAGVRLPSDPPEGARSPGGFDGPDLTAPFAGRDVLTQSGFGFAAAPVPADYAAPADPFPSESFPTAAFPTDAFPTGAFPTEAFPADAFPAGSDPEATLPDPPVS
jgi:Subtilase family